MLVVGASASPKVEQGGSPVDIGIKCTGFDLETLDLVSAIVLGQVLEESYSEVNKDSHDSFVKVDATRRRGGIRPSWKCGSLCPDDDAVVEVSNSNTRDGFVVDASWSCGGGNCVEDYNANLDLGFGSDGLRGSKKGMSAWEKAFVYALVETRRNTFRTIEECSISVMPATNIDKSS